MAKPILIFMGAFLIAIGLAGFLVPGLGGTHLSLLHNLLHLGSGVLSIYFGKYTSAIAARAFAILFGLFYFLLAVAGYFFGNPGIATVPIVTSMDIDPRLVMIVPGWLELGLRDHVLHFFLGMIFLTSGLLTRLPPIPSLSQTKKKPNGRISFHGPLPH